MTSILHPTWANIVCEPSRTSWLDLIHALCIAYSVECCQMRLFWLCQLLCVSGFVNTAWFDNLLSRKPQTSLHQFRGSQ